MTRNTDWSGEAEIMKAYVDTAKTYIQLSSAGLALPILIQDKLAGAGGSTSPSAGAAWRIMIATCCAFLLAVCVGALYQFAAAKYLEKFIDPAAYVPVTAQIIIDRGPGFLLNIEFFAFLAGAVGVVTYSIILLKP